VRHRVGAILAVTLSLAMAGAFARPAAAHPHVFIEDRVVFMFAADKIIAITESWTFDEVFSDTLVQQFDANGDGAFDAAESKAVAKGTLPNLKKFRYFNYIWVDGKDLGSIDPIDFTAVAKNKKVTFVFSVKLPKPVDPKTQKLKVEINDREFYVEVDLAQNQPILFHGNQGVTCTPKIRDDTENAYYGGFVYPQEITLSCH
jgi:tRNA threonylcarbamoyladenosine biosynthesis protein TsaE